MPPPHAARLGRASARRAVVCTALVAAALAAGACGPRYVRSAPLGSSGPSQPLASLSRNVVVISVDGLRPDAIGEYGAATLQRRMREGGYSVSASTIFPSKTLPSHTSMLTGLPPEQHGVLWNTGATARTNSIDLPNVFSVARAHGYSTAAFFSKSKFQPLQVRNTLDYSQAPGGWFNKWSSARTVADVRTYLTTAKPNLLFVHLADPDGACHRTGWMTEEYGRAVLAADTAVRQLIELSESTYGRGQFSLVVTADHGGHGTNHGSQDPRDVTIPWIAWGQGVRPGELQAPTISTMDTASTVL